MTTHTPKTPTRTGTFTGHCLHRCTRRKQTLHRTLLLLAGLTSLSAHAVEFAEDFSTNQTLSASTLYRVDPSPDGIHHAAEITDGHLVLEAHVTDEGRTTRLQPLAPTDYFEMVFTLSSDLDSVSARADAGIEGILFRSVPEDGGHTGEVRAILQLKMRGNGRRQAEFCLRHYLSADRSDWTDLLDPGDGSECLQLPFTPQMDTPYRARIAFDRSAMAVTFQLDGFMHEYRFDASFQAFAPIGQPLHARVNRHSPGVSQLRIDTLRTASSALTETERTAGLSEPPPFPDTLSLEAPPSDAFLTSTFDRSAAVDFIDDFSVAPSPIRFWSFPEGSRVDIQGNEDGSVALSAQSLTGDTAISQLSIEHPGDVLVMDAALSSETDIPLESDARARVLLTARLFNDVAPRGNGSEIGDIHVDIGLTLRGNGELQVSTYASRQNADGRDEFSELKDPISQLFSDTQITLDTRYRLTLGVDRTRDLLLIGVDDDIREIALPTNAHLPYRTEASLQTQHQATSGITRAVIYGVDTGNAVLDFTAAAPRIPLYRPGFNEQYPGRRVTFADGQALFEADNAEYDRQGAHLTALGTVAHIGADIALEPGSRVDGEDVISIGVGGVLYNDTAARTESSLGAVFGAVAIEVVGAASPRVVYCLWRSNDERFGDSTQLVGEDPDNCAQFETVPEYAVQSPASVSLDRDQQTVTFRFADEIAVYDVMTDTHEPLYSYAGIRSESSGSARVLGSADNLAFSADPAVLGASGTLLGLHDAGQGETQTGGSSGGGSAAMLTGMLFWFAWTRRTRRQRRLSARNLNAPTVAAGR